MKDEFYRTQDELHALCKEFEEIEKLTGVSTSILWRLYDKGVRMKVVK